jgi:hypothetical protein
MLACTTQLMCHALLIQVAMHYSTDPSSYALLPQSAMHFSTMILKKNFGRKKQQLNSLLIHITGIMK